MCVVFGLIAILVSGVHRFPKTKFSCVAIGLALTFLCNQHCLQPWAWQTFIFAVLLLCFPNQTEFKRWASRIVISIYLFSAIGKFDYQFIHTLGDSFLNTLIDWVGAEKGMPDELRPWTVGLFPAGELAIAIGLMFNRTRRIAAAAAIGLHIVLIAILSPLGLNHRPAVLIWNAMSILLVYWLFFSSSKTGIGDATPQTKPARRDGLSTFGTVFGVIVLIGPLLRPVQLWDHWLAWGLYSPSNSRVELLVSESAQSKLPPSVAEHLRSAETIGMLELKLDLWSLEELNAPIYPQARVQRSIADQFLNQHQLQQQARIKILGPSHPWTGRRTIRNVSPN